MLSKNVRLNVIVAIEKQEISLVQLIAILELYYMRNSFTEQELEIISNAYTKVITGEITKENYMDFFTMLKPIKRTDRDKLNDGLKEIFARKSDIENLK